MARTLLPDPSGATIPSERAFVVHFHATSRAAGRVEHLASGRFVDFASRRGLLAFFAEFLDAHRAPRKGAYP